MIDEDFYRLYKASRDLVNAYKDIILTGPFADYIRDSRINLERYDNKTTDCLNRWLKEKK